MADIHQQIREAERALNKLADVRDEKQLELDRVDRLHNEVNSMLTALKSKVRNRAA